MTAARGREMSASGRGDAARRLSLIFPVSPRPEADSRPAASHPLPSPDNEVNGRRESLLNFNYTCTPIVHVKPGLYSAFCLQRCPIARRDPLFGRPPPPVTI